MAAEARHSVIVDADVARLAEVRTFVRGAAAAVGAPEDVVVDVVQAVDEALTNVVVHGYRSQPGSIDVTLERRAGRLIVTIEDSAPPFDPTVVPEPDLDGDSPRRFPGGMGVHLMRAAMDSLTHRIGPGGGNILTMVRTLSRRESEDG